MLVAYLTPLAPAAILLLGAFILWLVYPRLLAQWQVHPGIRSFGVPVLVGLAVLALLGIRLTVGANAMDNGLELISGWNFSTAESAAALTVRADVFSLIFLWLTCVILLSVTLTHPTLQPPNDRAERQTDVGGWLALGAAACLLVVSGNNLTRGYAVVAFDVLTALFWLRRRQTGLSVSRLFLGVVSAGGLAMATIEAVPGSFLFGLALWLRLGLYPFFEATRFARSRDYGGLVYTALSLTVGFYLVSRGLTEPLPEIVHWLAVITMLLNGLLTWLTDQRASVLNRLVLTQASLILVIEMPNEGFGTALAVGLVLSLVALWNTRRLGKPNWSDTAWLWTYLPPIAATLTLIGLPFTLGWPVPSTIYHTLFPAEGTIIASIVVLAEGLALSGLVRYWLWVWQGSERAGRQSVAGIIAMIPFLIPGLGPLILAAITRMQLPQANLAQSGSVFFVFAAILALAIGSGYFRRQIIKQLKITPGALAEHIDLRWLLYWSELSLNWISKMILRVRVFLEGQHYVGWSLFIALVGFLIFLLETER